eukprot:1158298-Pelagomonas_calceolata.AAC.3
MSYCDIALPPPPSLHHQQLLTGPGLELYFDPWHTKCSTPINPDTHTKCSIPSAQPLLSRAAAVYLSLAPQTPKHTHTHAYTPMQLRTFSTASPRSRAAASRLPSSSHTRSTREASSTSNELLNLRVRARHDSIESQRKHNKAMRLPVDNETFNWHRGMTWHYKERHVISTTRCDMLSALQQRYGITRYDKLSALQQRHWHHQVGHAIGTSMKHHKAGQVIVTIKQDMRSVSWGMSQKRLAGHTVRAKMLASSNGAV